MKDQEQANSLSTLLEHELMGRYGPLISNDDLRLALGFASMNAFRQAIVRKTIPIPVFPLAKRRGKYALVKDVAIWLAQQREVAISQMSERKG